jgi:hypothetical protein
MPTRESRVKHDSTYAHTVLKYYLNITDIGSHVTKDLSCDGLLQRGQRFLHAVHHHCIINILFHRSDNAAKATTLAGKFKGTLYHLWTEK